ncbi:MAG: type IIL restriction-modification enzyme MmeI, partial [Vicinamibacteria bacterium]
RVLAISEVTSYVQLAFLPARLVYAHTLYVFPLPTHAAFCALQSRPHEIWARFFGSSMKDDLRYTPSDCFETFPFPERWETHPALEAAGKAYDDFRAALMIKNDEGLTKTYNRFHDPDERDPEIQRLRELHAVMDRAVLDAYGWSDIQTDCEFLLDYEIDEEEWSPRRKKPWRYRWPDDTRDEVLARLLELNAARAKQEISSGVAAAPKKRGRKSAAKRGRKAPDTGNLF